MSPFETSPGISVVDIKSAMFPMNNPKKKPLKWSEARRVAIHRDGSCRMCSSTGLLTVHHFWPRGTGGGNELDNLVTLCEKCHQNISSSCSRANIARVPGWAHSEHRLKHQKIHITLGEIFNPPAEQCSGRKIPAIPWMDFMDIHSRKMALPWECGKEIILAGGQEQMEEYV